MLNDEHVGELSAIERRVLEALDTGDSAEVAYLYSQHPDLRPPATLFWIRGSSRRNAGEDAPAADDFLRCAAELASDSAHSDVPVRGWLRTKALGSAGECLYRLGSFDRAYESFQNAIRELEQWLQSVSLSETQEKRQSHAWLYAMASESLREMGRTGEALEYAGRAVELAPEDGGFRVTYGLALQKAGLHRDAIDAFDQAISLDASLTGVHTHRGESLSALDDNEEGTLTRDKDESAARLGAVNTALADQSADAVRAAARAFVEHVPDGAGALRQRADEIEEESPDKAAEILTGLLEARPGDADALRQRGMLRLYDLEDYEGALADLQASFAIVRGDPAKVRALRLHHLIGEAFWALDRYDDAAASYHAALSDESDPAMLAELHLRIAECLVPLGRHEEARPHLADFWAGRAAFMEEINDEERLEWARQQRAGHS